MGTSSNTREESEEVDAAAAMHDDAGDEGSEGAAMYEEEDETGPNTNESSSNRRLQQSPSSHQLEPGFFFDLRKIIIWQRAFWRAVGFSFFKIHLLQPSDLSPPMFSPTTQFLAGHD
jgi:hypothetical protein